MDNPKHVSFWLIIIFVSFIGWCIGKSIVYLISSLNAKTSITEPIRINRIGKFVGENNNEIECYSFIDESGTKNNTIPFMCVSLINKKHS